MEDKLVCWLCGSRFDTKRAHDIHYTAAHPDQVIGKKLVEEDQWLMSEEFI